MLKKTSLVLAAGLFALVTGLPAGAQEIATLALKSGERPSGELIDLNASGFTLRINGQDRQVPAGDVAAVEFVVGPVSPAAQAKINAGQPVVILRNGDVIDGRLTDIGGARPLRLTIDTPSGQREFTSGDVAQIHLQPVGGASAGQAVGTAGGAVGPGAITVTVPANANWTDTGIGVARGERVQFSATGDIMISANASSGAGGSPAATVPNIRYPLPGAPAGALIGRVGSGAPFLIGVNTQPIVMPAAGRLWIGINDDHTADNTGNYVVSITRLGR